MARPVFDLRPFQRASDSQPAQGVLSIIPATMGRRVTLLPIRRYTNLPTAQPALQILGVNPARMGLWLTNPSGYDVYFDSTISVSANSAILLAGSSWAFVWPYNLTEPLWILGANSAAELRVLEITELREAH